MEDELVYRPSLARCEGLENTLSDFPSQGVTGLTAYFSDLHTLRGEVWKIHYQTCHTL